MLRKTYPADYIFMLPFFCKKFKMTLRCFLILICVNALGEVRSEYFLNRNYFADNPEVWRNLRKMLDEGLLYKPKPAVYKLTDKGKLILKKSFMVYDGFGKKN